MKRKAEEIGQDRASLRRSIGPATGMFLTAAMIIGTGLFAALGATAKSSGSGLLLSIVLSGVVIMLVGLSAAQLGITYPEEGGGFTWSRKFDRPLLGFVVGCSYIGKAFVSIVVIALAFATYTAQAFPGIPLHITAGAGIVAVTVFNYFDVNFNVKVLIVLLLVELVLLAVFVGASVHAIHPAHLLPILGKGVPGVVAGAALFFWSWDGFMRTAIMASEMDRPRRTIPLSIVGGIIFAAVVFLA